MELESLKALAIAGPPITFMYILAFWIIQIDRARVNKQGVKGELKNVLVAHICLLAGGVVFTCILMVGLWIMDYF